MYLYLMYPHVILLPRFTVVHTSYCSVFPQNILCLAPKCGGGPGLNAIFRYTRPAMSAHNIIVLLLQRDTYL